MTPGSEFRPPSILEFVFKRHKLWPGIKESLNAGAHIHLSNGPDEKQRHLENLALIEFNNHRKARENSDIIQKSIKQDIDLGFCTPISIDTIRKIPNAMVCPLGIVEQQTLSASGERRTKLRLTHDQSFTILEGSESLNTMTNQAAFPELIYGSTLQRIIYQALALRRDFPDSLILCCKNDFAKAYRRVHYNGISAARCISVHEGLGFILWRLSFGGSGCPHSWCPFGEIITDLANDLLSNPDWNPGDFGPQDDLPPLEPIRLPDSVRIEPTLPSLLQPPSRPEGFADVYVDDTMTIFLDTPQTLKRAPYAIHTATSVVARPSHAQEPIQREHLLSQEKYMAEGAPSETKVILGWLVNFRTLSIHLPDDKLAAWRNDIQTLQLQKFAHKKTLEQLIGRLNHTCNIIPMARYFIGPLRHLHSLGKHDRSKLKLNKLALTLLDHWKRLLEHAHDGINFNLVTIRKPTNITITDACPSGLGGYSIKTGRAWRIELVPNGDISNNILEFLAAAIGIIEEHRSGAIPKLGQILALTDNSSAVGWLQHANANPSTSPTLYKIAIELANTCISSSFSIYPLHIPGKSNGTADALSRLHDLSDDELTQHVLSHFVAQTPPNFKLYPLHPETYSWISSIVATRQESSMEQQKTHTKNKIEPGDDGSHSCQVSTSTTTNTSTTGNTNNAQISARHSSKLSDRDISHTATTDDFQHQIRESFASELSKLPLANWLRNSGTLDDPARFTSKTTPTGSIHASKHYFVHGTS
jgi:hypothetical protein